QRVAIEIQVARVVAYPDGAALEDPDVFGAERPPPPSSQEQPRGGTEPRVSVESVAAHAERLPHTLLGWCGSDDLPDVVPVSSAHQAADGLRLDFPSGSVPLGTHRTPSPATGCRAPSFSTTSAARPSHGECEAPGGPGSSASGSTGLGPYFPGPHAARVTCPCARAPVPQPE